MKPEILILLQLYAQIESYGQSQIELLCLIAGKIENLPNDGIEALIRQQKVGVRSYSDKLLEKFLYSYQSSFGESSDISPDELRDFLKGLN